MSHDNGTIQLLMTKEHDNIQMTWQKKVCVLRYATSLFYNKGLH